MRVLLDEPLPRPFGRLLKGHDVSTVGQEGWASHENGELLREAATRFDVLLTVDQNLEFQQNLTSAEDAGARKILVIFPPSLAQSARASALWRD